MQNFGDKKGKITIFWKKLIINENFQWVFIVHEICIMTVAEKQHNILHVGELDVFTRN